MLIDMMSESSYACALKLNDITPSLNISGPVIERMYTCLVNHRDSD